MFEQTQVSHLSCKLSSRGSVRIRYLHWPRKAPYNVNRSTDLFTIGTNISTSHFVSCSVVITVSILWRFERSEVKFWLHCCFMVTVRHTTQTASVHDHWLTGKCLPGPCKVVISPPCGMSNVDLSDYIFTPLQHKACFCSVLTATLVELA